MKDFAPTDAKISLHGLGFLQVKLGGNQRLHVWHPDLPRRSCFAHSAIHNHRFSFRSTVLVGQQVNRRYNVVEASSHACNMERISHDGPRGPYGGRLSYVAGYVNVEPLPDEVIDAGESYHMPALQYHETPNSGVVVTLMEKLFEGEIHASSLIRPGLRFDQEFDRFQMPEADMWSIVTEAMAR